MKSCHFRIWLALIFAAALADVAAAAPRTQLGPVANLRGVALSSSASTVFAPSTAEPQQSAQLASAASLVLLPESNLVLVVLGNVAFALVAAALAACVVAMSSESEAGDDRMETASSTSSFRPADSQNSLLDGEEEECDFQGRPLNIGRSAGRILAPPSTDRERPVRAQVAFESSSMHYCIIRADAQPEVIMDCVVHKYWDLEPAKLIISVVGGADHFKVDLQMLDRFSRGLVEAAERTSAYIITGGTDSGVMDIVGKAVRKHDTFRRVPCIGIVPFGALKPSWRKELLSGGRCRPVVDVASIYAREYEDDDGAGLQENHTHCILCDDGQEGAMAYGCEVDFRADFEKYVAGERGDDEEHNLTGLDLPRVMVLVNGGTISLQVVAKVIRDGCPVVVCSGTGRAADAITTLVEARLAAPGGEGLQKALACFGGESLTEEEKQLLEEITCSPCVIIYHAAESLPDVILKGLLVQKGGRPDYQILLAAQWKCPEYIDCLGARLVEQHNGDMDAVIGWVLRNMVGFKQENRRRSPICNTPRTPASMGRGIQHRVLHAAPVVTWLIETHRQSVETFVFKREKWGTIHWEGLNSCTEWCSIEGLFIWSLEQEADEAVLQAIWTLMEDPVHGALVGADVCREMVKRRKGNTNYSNVEKSKRLEEIADRLEQLSVILLKDLAASNRLSPVEYLFQESARWGNASCFDLAYWFGCQRFVSTDFYKLGTDRYWMTPSPFSFKQRELNGKYLSPLRLLRLTVNPSECGLSVQEFFSVPYIKAYTHTLSRFTFVVVYSFGIFYGKLWHGAASALGAALLAYAVGLTVVEIDLIGHTSLLEYLCESRNILDVVHIGILMIGLLASCAMSDHTLRVTGAGRMFEIGHAINLLPSYLRLLLSFQLSEYFGTLLMTAMGMCRDMAYFFALLAIVCMAFGSALTPIIWPSHAGRMGHSILWAFEALFRYPEEAREAASHLDSPTSWLAVALLYLMAISVSVLLVNLLIAIMNNTYTVYQAESHHLYNFHRVHAVLEYGEVLSMLPPPLNVLSYCAAKWSHATEKDEEPPLAPLGLYRRESQPAPPIAVPGLRPQKFARDRVKRATAPKIIVRPREFQEAIQKALAAVRDDKNQDQAPLLAEIRKLRARNADLERLAADHLLAENRIGTSLLD